MSFRRNYSTFAIEDEDEVTRAIVSASRSVRTSRNNGPSSPASISSRVHREMRHDHGTRNNRNVGCRVRHCGHSEEEEVGRDVGWRWTDFPPKIAVDSIPNPSQGRIVVRYSAAPCSVAHCRGTTRDCNEPFAINAR